MRTARHLQGYALQGWFAPDITGDKRVGVGAWSVDDIVEYLKTGANRYTAASGPMAEEISNSTSHWTLRRSACRGDLSAGSARSQQRRRRHCSAQRPSDAGRRRDLRRRVLRRVTRWMAAGIARLLPTLKGSPFVQQDNPGSLLHVVLHGTRAVATGATPTAPAMPAFDWKLSDEQVAAVVTYIRNAWGNAAPAVTAGQAHTMRNELKRSPGGS